MNHNILTQAALRYRGVFLDISREEIDMQSETTVPVMAFIRRLKENGFCVSEELLHALNSTPANRLAEIARCIQETMGVNLNWAPLVKEWDVPTGETLTDHLTTWIANLLGKEAGIEGTTLPCGHLIPEGTFPLERYNGCPFCGMPFETAGFVYQGTGSKLKELQLLTADDMRAIFSSLLTSPTPPDATQKEVLEQLLQVFPLPDGTDIAMKETVVLVIRSLVKQGKDDAAAELMQTPADVLRYLWYEKTGYAQVIEPKTLVAHARKLYRHMWGALDRGADAAQEMKQRLMLKYDRKTCLRVARWMNALPVTARQAAESMHPKRSMWVRMIRALRLGEYSRKSGFEHLAAILDVFYKQDYSTWQGRVDKACTANNAEQTLALLRERPGLFARCLFSMMLRFGSDRVLSAFRQEADRLPARLLLSLGNAAEFYFNPDTVRLVRPITGVTHRIAPHMMLDFYSPEELKGMADSVNTLYRDSMKRRFAAQPTASKSIYIDPVLYQIPVGIGDRSTTTQDISCALTGIRFPIEGDAVRLFLQWGKGLHAQHLDMDLSCRIALPNGRTQDCAFYSLTCVGAKHSGDIRFIPDMAGTAEYIELSLPELEQAGAQYVTFSCNAYSTGALSRNLIVGWMSSAYPMEISETTGVAYDPSCVQHMVRISENNLSKGLIFGVLEVAKREIIWIEMPFTAQTLKGADESSVEALLHKLEKKLSIGQLLDIKAEAQQLALAENKEEADEAYTYEWALHPDDVSKLLSAAGS